jgi:hypothetical protein
MAFTVCDILKIFYQFVNLRSEAFAIYVAANIFTNLKFWIFALTFPTRSLLLRQIYQLIRDEFQRIANQSFQWYLDFDVNTEKNKILGSIPVLNKPGQNFKISIPKNKV